LVVNVDDDGLQCGLMLSENNILQMLIALIARFIWSSLSWLYQQIVVSR